MNKNSRDIAGYQNGSLLAIKPLRTIRGGVVWELLCECGTRHEALGTRLTTANLRSCGCHQTKWSAGDGRKPSVTLSKLTWESICRRFTDPTHPLYKLYGAVGRQVDKAWLTSFELFLAEVGLRPSASHYLEHIDPSLPMRASNVRWNRHWHRPRRRADSEIHELDGLHGTTAELSRHFKISTTSVRRRLKDKVKIRIRIPTIEYRGRRLTLKDWSLILGIRYNVLYSRIYMMDWDIHTAFTTPARRRITKIKGVKA